ncbi:MAG: glycosyltransferase family 2 protein [Candidatus Methanofastidiosa archaeon]|nr:glycosyltransferase family 2 protein [Candidatus Methanofastidiosa archaeon]
MKKISVIISTYNSSKFIRRTIRSVFQQKGFEKDFCIELLLIDDGSDEKELLYLEKLVNSIHNTLTKAKSSIRLMRLFHNTGGPNAGRNKGIENATGDLIAFLDHDDEWTENKLLTQLKQIENGYEFVYSPCTKQLG